MAGRYKFTIAPFGSTVVPFDVVTPTVIQMPSTAWMSSDLTRRSSSSGEL